jgi:thioredoxin reductase (NADPH)
MMNLFREQSVHHGTEIITETITKIDLSSRPFKLWTEGNENKEPACIADSVIIATGATAKRVISNLIIPRNDLISNI